MVTLVPIKMLFTLVNNLKPVISGRFIDHVLHFCLLAANPVTHAVVFNLTRDH